MIWVTVAALGLALVAGIAAVALWSKLEDALDRLQAETSSRIDWERNCHAARADAGLARSELATARQELEAERRARHVERSDYEMRLAALREANEELRRKRGPGFRP